MANTTKVTNKSALNFVLDNCELPKEITDKLNSMIAALDKKSATGEKKPTATQIANEGYKALIVDYLTSIGKGATCADMIKEIPEFNDFSTSKVSALTKQLVDTKTIDKEMVKGRAYFKAKVEG
jgi:hypothetical protein